MSPEDRAQFEKMKQELAAIKQGFDVAFIETMARRLENSFTIPRLLSDLQDVSSATPTNGQVLKYNGSQWAPGTDNTA